MSSDGGAAHEKFATKYKLPFMLLSDRGGVVRKQYGVPATLGLLPGRVTFVIDKQGIVQRTFNSQFQATKHVAAKRSSSSGRSSAESSHGGGVPGAMAASWRTAGSCGNGCRARCLMACCRGRLALLAVAQGEADQARAVRLCGDGAFEGAGGAGRVALLVEERAVVDEDLGRGGCQRERLRS